MLTPIHAWSTRPLSISSAATSRTVLIGIAKPMPTFPPEGEKIAVFTPITWPRPFRSGPPELPWLMAASVWMTRSIVNSAGERSSR